MVHSFIMLFVRSPYPSATAAGYMESAEGTGAHPRAGAPDSNQLPWRRARAYRPVHPHHARSCSGQALLLSGAGEHGLYRA